MHKIISGLLGHLPLSQKLEERFQNPASQWHKLYLFSNDSQVFSTLIKLEKTAPVETVKTRIGFVIGESYINSSLPELALHCDLIVMNDIDFRNSQHTQFLIETLRNSANRKDFYKQYFSTDNPIPDHYFLDTAPYLLGIKENVYDKKGTLVPIMERHASNQGLRSIKVMNPKTHKEKDLYFRMGRSPEFKVIVYKKKGESYHEVQEGIPLKYRHRFLHDFLVTTQPKAVGAKHFLGSKKRYTDCREAAKKLQFSFTNINILEQTTMESFSDLLNQNNAEITLLNISNVHQYDTENYLRETLSTLPIPANTLIITSGENTLKTSLFDTLQSNLHIGLKNFIFTMASENSTRERVVV